MSGALRFRCGTFGCTLPNNHRGLHVLPKDEMLGKRRRTQTVAKSSEKRFAVRVNYRDKVNALQNDSKWLEKDTDEVNDEEIMVRDDERGVPAELDDSGRGGLGFNSSHGDEHEEQEVGVVGPRARESSSRKRMPSAKLRGAVCAL